jgi:hypothetical protein
MIKVFFHLLSLELSVDKHSPQAWIVDDYVLTGKPEKRWLDSPVYSSCRANSLCCRTFMLWST